MRGQKRVRVGIRTLLHSSRFSQHGSTLSHHRNNLLHLHMMNTTMNRQQRKTIHTDMNSTMISLQHHNLILRPNLKPKTTSHSQDKPIPVSPNALRFPLSVEGSASPKSTQSRPNNHSMYILLSGGLSADTNLCRLGLGIQPIKTL